MSRLFTLDSNGSEWPPSEPAARIEGFGFDDDAEVRIVLDGGPQSDTLHFDLDYEAWRKLSTSVSAHFDRFPNR